MVLLLNRNKKGLHKMSGRAADTETRSESNNEKSITESSEITCRVLETTSGHAFMVKGGMTYDVFT